MPDFFKNAIIFIRQNPAISYSLLLIFLLPLVLYISTFWTIQSMDRGIKMAIRSQAAMNRDALSLFLLRDFSGKNSLDRDALQKDIDLLVATGAENGEGSNLENIRIVVKEGKYYRAIAAQNREIIDKPINTDPSLNGESLIAFAWANATKDYGSEIEQNGKKYFRIIKPFLDSDSGEVYALVVADIPTNRIIDEITWVAWRATALTAVAIALSLFLVFQHAKLFYYVSLSRKLQSENKAKDDFIRMATHELRSPVTVITAYIESLKEELASVASEEQKKYIERIAISIKNLSNLMSDILEVSHIQQGRTDFKPEKIFVAKTVKEIADGIRPKAEAKNLKLVFESGDLEHTINANSVCFSRIVTNLIENAVKYTPAGKVTVSVSAQTAKKRCVITVQDTGFGISAEGQNHLFEQFYRVKTEENADIPGTGLGLWMSREMARKMGGDIMLESIERLGSRFFIFFPLADK